jgi:hypothetical protein
MLIQVCRTFVGDNTIVSKRTAEMPLIVMIPAIELEISGPQHPRVVQVLIRLHLFLGADWKVLHEF